MAAWRWPSVKLAPMAIKTVTSASEIAATMSPYLTALASVLIECDAGSCIGFLMITLGFVETEI